MLRPSKQSLRVYVDGTLGAGGHASMVLREHQDLRVLVGVDLDPSALAVARPRLQALARPETALHFVHANYRCGALLGRFT